MGAGKGQNRRVQTAGSSALQIDPDEIFDHRGNPTIGEGAKVNNQYMKKWLMTGADGVQAWNSWRIENGEEQIRITDFEFDNLKLDGINFNNCMLSQGKIQNTELNEATFNASNMNQVTFSDSSLNKASFEAAHLKRTIFENACLKSAFFEYAALDSRDTEIPVFNKTEMSNVNMQHANFHKVKFRSCRLINSSFAQATVRSGRLSFEDSDLQNINLQELGGSMNVCDSNMVYACLYGIKLHTSGIYRSVFKNVHLVDANCETVKWDGVLVEHSIVSNTDFSGAHLQNTHFIGNTRLSDIKFSDTKLQSCKIEHNKYCDFKPGFILESSSPEGVYVTNKGVYTPKGQGALIRDDMNPLSEKFDF